MSLCCYCRIVIDIVTQCILLLSFPKLLRMNNYCKLFIMPLAGSIHNHKSFFYLLCYLVILFHQINYIFSVICVLRKCFSLFMTLVTFEERLVCAQTKKIMNFAFLVCHQY